MLQNPEESKKLANMRVQNQLEELGICCFCKENDHILMWAHYTDNHLGVCLKFDVLEDHNLFFAGGYKPIGLVHNVEYRKKYPQLNVYNVLVEKAVTRILPFTKSNEWMYEKEFRLISSKLKGISFNKNALVEVTFGCRINEAPRFEGRKTKKAILKVLRENKYSNIKYFQARPSPNRYELEFEKLENI